MREDATRLVVGAHSHDWGVRLDFEHVKHLTVTIEEHDASLKHVLKDEVLVIIADFNDIALDEIVERSLPLGRRLVGLCVVVDLFLSDFSVQDFLVHARAQTVRDTSLGVLNEEWLIVLREKALTDQDTFIDERLLFVHSNLAHLDVQFN